MDTSLIDRNCSKNNRPIAIHRRVDAAILFAPGE
jgi:hypothetical protein